MKPAWAPIVATMLLSAAVVSAPAVSAAAPVRTCPAHAGRITLSGTLVRHTFAGPPNYESVRKGDAPETYWLIRFAHKTCVGTPPDDMHVGPVIEVQLVLDPAQFTHERRRMGRRVTVSGSASLADTGHHHTPIILSDVRFER